MGTEKKDNAIGAFFRTKSTCVRESNRVNRTGVGFRRPGSGFWQSSGFDFFISEMGNVIPPWVLSVTSRGQEIIYIVYLAGVCHLVKITNTWQFQPYSHKNVSVRRDLDDSTLANKGNSKTRGPASPGTCKKRSTPCPPQNFCIRIGILPRPPGGAPAYDSTTSCGLLQ